MTTTTYTATLVAVDCAECGTPFGMTDRLLAARQQDGAVFWCPNGHKNVYQATEADLLRRRLANAEARVTHEHDQREAAERSASAHKGQATRLRKRIANGVCPDCHRHFANVQRHMASQHAGSAR